MRAEDIETDATEILHANFWTSERDLDKARGSRRKGRSVAALPANTLRGDLGQDLVRDCGELPRPKV
jgi:hypothetical protein